MDTKSETMDRLGHAGIMGKTLDKDEISKNKQQRSDEISTLMGHYLLKGWKMLSEICPKCETILFQKPSGQYYCVACMEIDSDTVSAKKQPIASNKSSEMFEDLSSELSSPDKDNVRVSALSKTIKRAPKQCNEIQAGLPTNNRKHKHRSMVIALQEKVIWCMSRLTEATSPTEICQWCDTLMSLYSLWDEVAKSSLLKH
uniref:Sjoegren syndrome/scleroderma autoantigen 1 n=1 Tax=Trichobilharzia regenti TaxID=157069 RepID=A0AA85JNS4_TRIRE|nr:unnamed protein product [Trichobilharzia regenti]